MDFCELLMLIYTLAMHTCISSHKTSVLIVGTKNSMQQNILVHLNLSMIRPWHVLKQEGQEYGHFYPVNPYRKREFMDYV